MIVEPAGPDSLFEKWNSLPVKKRGVAVYQFMGFLLIILNTRE
jgi:hypothetical protein